MTTTEQNIGLVDCGQKSERGVSANCEAELKSSLKQDAVIDIPQLRKAQDDAGDGARITGQAQSETQQAQGRASRFLMTYWANLRRRPFLLLGPPLIIFAVCVALGVYGVVAGADQYEGDERGRVYGTALDWSAGFKLSLEKTFTPLTTLSIFIKQTPNFLAFRPMIPSIMDDLIPTLDNNTIQELQIAPLGRIGAIAQVYPWPTSSLGLDIFNQSALRGGALNTVRARQLVINGPTLLVGGAYTGAIARIPIFIKNSTAGETFGTNFSSPTSCPEGLCFNNATGEKFWGFVTALISLNDLKYGNDTRLNLLKDKQLRWSMTRPWTTTETQTGPAYVFSQSPQVPTNPVAINITVSNAVWTLYLEREDGWRPNWEKGMIALVVCGSFILAVLVGLVTASWAQQQNLLEDVLEANAALAATTQNLQEERMRLDALLVRQYNLISVLGAGTKNNGRDANGSIHASKEGLTLERIELMRRQLAVSNTSSAQDIENITTLEMLGQGTFGKVYKGLWRGTVVAVKTMVLPANMSGAEKREKMAVMEAAISSSLSHPNVVQTYTYAIKPMRDTTTSANTQGDDSFVTRTKLDPIDMSNVTADTARNTDASNATSNVHSYEVRLVLEFCDKGCLRDALDDGIFLSPQGINYRAVLDTTADVAKAMLHLHSMNVLHSDLKARNVMLQSGGADGRGVVAKVADFGLSLQIDHMETHVSAVYQGTLTHMAPEILLEGRVSKGADVYAFGITMWELYTGGHAFKGVPRALIGHQIAREGLRPKFPANAPAEYVQLAERCWHPDVSMRPTFEQVLSELTALRAAERGVTPPLTIITRARMGLSNTTTGSAAHAPVSGPSIVLGDGSTMGITGSTNVDPRLVKIEAAGANGSQATEGTSAWSMGMALIAGPADSMSMTRARPLPMPQVVESHESNDGRGGGGAAAPVAPPNGGEPAA